MPDRSSSQGVHQFESLTKHLNMKLGALLHTLPITRLQQPFSGTVGSGNFELVNANRNQFYVAQIAVGDSGQLLNVCLDTGSADTWFRGKNCRSSDGSCNSSLTFLDPSLDSSIKKAGSASFSKRYGSGKVGAFIYYAKTSISTLTAPALPIGIAASLQGFNNGVEDGLMGLSNGLGQISASLGGLVDTNFMKNAGVSVFSFYLSNDRGDGKDKGSLTVNGYDKSKVSGPVTYVPVIEPHTTWNINVESFRFRINDATAATTFPMAVSNKKAFPDTGCTLVLLEDSVADKVNGLISARGYDKDSNTYPISCTLATLPTVQILIGDEAVFSIPPQIYVMKDATGDTCYSGFTRGAGHAGMGVVLGDTFLRAVVSIYDNGKQRVGFAQALHPL